MPYSVSGTGPVTFLDGNSSQHEIPLSALSLDSNKISAATWPGYNANPQNPAIIDGVLAWMLAQGFLSAGTEITAPLTITAIHAGPSGNEISVTFDPDTAAGTMTVTVAATQVFAGLTVADLATALGTDAPSSGGILFLSGAAPATGVPAALAKTAIDLTTFKLDVNDATPAVLFTLEAADQTATPAAVDVTITLDAAPEEFTITATSTKSAAGLKVADLVGASSPFKLLVTFTGPVDTLLPAPGTVTLSGGAAASTPPAIPATPASATVLTS